MKDNRNNPSRTSPREERVEERVFVEMALTVENAVRGI
jgi:hypothetical protein